MNPKFLDYDNWSQVEQLMQPALIRILDQMRIKMEELGLKGTYVDVLIWPDGVSEQMQSEGAMLYEQLKMAKLDEKEALAMELMRYPEPYIGYQLNLEYEGQVYSLELWQLCYQVCCRNYSLSLIDSSILLEVDSCLIDSDGEINWKGLDDKTKDLISQILNNLNDSE